MPDYSFLPYLRAAGFKGEALRNIWATSMAEGGSNNRAHNYNPATGDDSYGRLQINMLGALGPDRLKRYGLKSNEDLYDPATNARVAYEMSGGGKNLQPWSAFKNGSYKKYYDQWNPSMAPGGSVTPPQRQAAVTPGVPPDQKRQAIAGLLDTALSLSTNGAVQPNLFAKTIGAVSSKGSITPPTVKGVNGAPELPTAGNSLIDKALAVAHDQVGKPYVYGSGPDTSSFDCSDLIQYAYKQVGINLPRTTYDQIKMGTSVPWGKFQPGDLIFSHNGGHVVMYVGNGKVIAAPHTGTVVQYQPVSRFKNSFVDARRVA